MEKKKILLIEDEIVLAEMYKDRFEKEGFEMVVAFDAEEGLKLTRKEKPNLIILDILLPRGNGVSFLQKMRKISQIADIPVVILSNYDQPQTKEDALGLGAKAYLIKTDFTPDQLIKEMKKYLPPRARPAAQID